MSSTAFRSVSAEDRPIRVLLADDDPLARRAIREVLEAAAITVVGEVTDGYQAVELARYHRPDVLLIELDLPGLDAAEVTHRVVTTPPKTHVVVLSVSRDEETALRLLHAGASGFIPKDGDLEALARALATVVRGGAAVPEGLAMRLVELFRAVPRDGHGLRPIKSRLTNREWEIVDLLAEGNDTQAIAEELVLTMDTVYTHVKNLMRKLGVHSRADVVAAAAADREATMSGAPTGDLVLADDDADALSGAA